MDNIIVALNAHELSNATARDTSLGNPLRKEESRNITEAPEGFMKIDEIPYMSDTAPALPIGTVFPICNLIDEIADPKNISDSFDYVIDHLENADQRKKMRPKKAEYCKKLEEELRSGTFRITMADIRELTVKDGPKTRVCQCPRVYYRVGCHAVMVPVERYIHPTFIKNTAASIKGRGMHWLHQIIEEDLLADQDNMLYFYQSDILGYYDHVNQCKMQGIVRQYIADPVALPMIDNFITLMPAGLSKGLRSSQCLANLYLSEIDHKMCSKVSFHIVEVEDADKNVHEGIAVKGEGKIKIKGKEIRFHYYRYCDDIVIIARTKKELWELRNYLKSLLAELGLTIKPSEAVRPLKVSINYLGYNTYVDDSKPERVVYSRIRKRTKQKFARRLKDVKSRKRRQVLIGSFFGMAAHADCRHLLKKLLTPTEFRKLKHKRKMKDFSSFKVSPMTLDGKKNFKGKKISARELDRRGVIIVDFENLTPKRENEAYMRRCQDASAKNVDLSLVEPPKQKYLIQLICDGNLYKMWTGDKEIWHILDEIDAQKGLPFFVGIQIDYSTQYPKLNFVDPATLNIIRPTEEQIQTLFQKFNLNLNPSD